MASLALNQSLELLSRRVSRRCDEALQVNVIKIYMTLRRNFLLSPIDCGASFPSHQLSNFLHPNKTKRKKSLKELIRSFSMTSRVSSVPPFATKLSCVNSKVRVQITKDKFSSKLFSTSSG